MVRVSYRLSPPAFTFPQPIHDSSVAFSYILRNLVGDSRSSKAGEDGVLDAPRVTLFGSHIGGSLATSLALTCPHLVHSVIVAQPLLDWVSIDSRSSSSGGEKDGRGKDKTRDRSAERSTGIKEKTNGASKPKSSPMLPPSLNTTEVIEPLIAARRRLFPKPDYYFDPVASPTLLLRSPGRDCPDSGAEPDTSLPSLAAGAATGKTISTVESIQRRKVLRRWPAVPFPTTTTKDSIGADRQDADDDDHHRHHQSSQSVLSDSLRTSTSPSHILPPYFHIISSSSSKSASDSLLRRQADEFSQLMRRVCFSSAAAAVFRSASDSDSPSHPSNFAGAAPSSPLSHSGSLTTTNNASGGGGGGGKEAIAERMWRERVTVSLVGEEKVPPAKESKTAENVETKGDSKGIEEEDDDDIIMSRMIKRLWL